MQDPFLIIHSNVHFKDVNDFINICYGIKNICSLYICHTVLNKADLS